MMPRSNAGWIKVDGSFDNFNKFESFLIQRVRDLMLERIKEYLEQLDCEVSDCFKLSMYITAG